MDGLKEELKIILSGVGGQGLILSGTLLGEAAVVYDNKNATLTSSYGVETRGTFTKSDLIISDDNINYTEIVKPDVVLAMAQVAYDKYVKVLDENTTLIYDSSLVFETIESRARQCGIPITDMAKEMGNVTSANIIACGIIVKMTNIVALNSVIDAIKDIFSHKPKVLDLNLNAFNKGIEVVQMNNFYYE